MTTLLGSVQGVYSAAEEAAWLQDGGLQTGGETAARGDGQDEGTLGRNSQRKKDIEKLSSTLYLFSEPIANSNTFINYFA